MEKELERMERIKVYLKSMSRLKALISQKEVSREEIDEITGIWEQINSFEIDVRPPQELLYEAEILELCVALVRKGTDQIKTKNELTLDDFARYLSDKMLRKDATTPYGRWSRLGEEVRNMLPVQVYVSKLVIGQSDPHQPEKKPRRANKQDQLLSQSQRTQPKQITEEDERRDEEAKKTDMESMNKIYKQMKTIYKSSNKRPLSYLEFVVDPISFSKTIENIFTVSFLVRDNHVQMTKNEKEELVVKPLGKPGTRKSLNNTQKKQMIVSLNYEDWQFLVKKLKIKKPAIQDG